MELITLVAVVAVVAVAAVAAALVLLPLKTPDYSLPGGQRDWPTSVR